MAVLAVLMALALFNDVLPTVLTAARRAKRSRKRHARRALPALVAALVHRRFVPAPRARSIRSSCKDIRVEGVQRTEAGTVFTLPADQGRRAHRRREGVAGRQGAVRDRLLPRRAPRGAGRRARRHRAGAADDQLDHVRRQQGIRHRHDQEGAEGHRHRRGAHLRPLGARARRTGAEAPVHHARPVRGEGADDGDAAGAQPRRDQLHDRRRRRREASRGSTSSARRRSPSSELLSRDAR